MAYDESEPDLVHSERESELGMVSPEFHRCPPCPQESTDYVYMGTPHLSLQRQSYDMADDDDSNTAWGDSEREDELSVVSPEFRGYAIHARRRPADQ